MSIFIDDFLLDPFDLSACLCVAVVINSSFEARHEKTQLVEQYENVRELFSEFS